MQTLKRYAIGAFAAGTLVLAGLGASSALAQGQAKPAPPASDQSVQQMMDHCTAQMDRMGSMMGSMGS
ncbi:MAG: hypothetical protein ACRDYX_21720 [Egibacteraceae bacterium]